MPKDARERAPAPRWRRTPPSSIPESIIDSEEDIDDRLVDPAEVEHGRGRGVTRCVLPCAVATAALFAILSVLAVLATLESPWLDAWLQCPPPSFLRVGSFADVPRIRRWADM